MSADNVDRVRRWQLAMGTGPDDALAVVDEFFESDVDYYPVRKFPEARPRHGSHELAEFISEWWEAFSVSDWQIRDLIAVGDDRVLNCMTLSAEGRGSGVRLEGDLYQCTWLRHGRFFRVEDHLTLGGALQALGLEGDSLEAAGLRS